MIDAHHIETDSYDRDARARALAAPEARALVEKGARVVPHFDALVEDLFAVLFKLVLRERTGVPASAALAGKVLRAALASPALPSLRETCALDEARSASGALALARSALAELKKGELLSEEELLEQAALRRAEEYLASLASAREAAEGAKGEGAERVRARVERQMERAREQVAAMAEKVQRTLSELPPSLERRVEAAAEAAGQDVEGDEELARSLAESLGGEGPRSAAERLALAEKMRGSEKLRRLAQLAGAFRRDALAARRKRIRRSPAELHRIGRGADLARLLPSELFAYTDPRRRTEFLRRFVENDLAQYDIVGSDRGGRGPLVICVDGSGSMNGARELWAKAVALALLEIARRQNRRAEAVVFSGREAPLAHFPLLAGGPATRGGRRRVDLPGVLDFAACFPGGGTDFEKPLAASLNLLENSGLRGADIVFITDGEAQVTDAFAIELARQKKRLDFALYAVLVDDPSVPSRPQPGAEVGPVRAARELRKVADRITTVTRLTSGAVRDLFEAL
jgi:uncharacterized protein with von Willebrand factor type A (vWA) domain